MKTTVSLRRPTDVLNALRLLVICLTIELLGFAFSGDYSVGSVVGVLVGAALTFWVLRQVHAGVNWARFIIAGLIALGAFWLIASFRSAYAQHPGATVIDAFSTVISIIAGVLLFTKNSTAWFGGFTPPQPLPLKKEEGPEAGGP